MEGSTQKKTLKLSELAFHNADQNVAIASGIRDLIQDYKCLEKEKRTTTAGKHRRSEALPPNTSNFRQHKLIRDLTELGDRLKEEIEQCNRVDLVRQHKLEEVAEKTTDLAQKFQEAERAYNGVLKERETHCELMEVFSKEVKDYDMNSKRYAKCGVAVDEIRRMMETIIEENKCYLNFVKSLAGNNMSSSAASQTLAEFISQFETIESASNNIAKQMDEALSKAEKSQLKVMQIKNEFVRELKFNIEGLITSHSAMEHAGIMNERYEKALNTMRVDTVETITTMAKVLNSADNMIENLITSKAVDHSYRKKTLAQQFEAIREDYVKKKAILHEYHKSRAKQDKKKAYMAQAFDKEELLQERMNRQKVRMDDLTKKRGQVVLMRQRDLRLKEEKRRRYMSSDINVREKEEPYNPLEDPIAVLDLDDEERPENFSLPDPDDDDDDEASGTEDEEDELTVYSSSASDSLLVAESEEQVSLLMAAEADVLSLCTNSEKRRVAIRESLSSALSNTSNDASRDRRMSSFFSDTLL